MLPIKAIILVILGLSQKYLCTMRPKYWGAASFMRLMPIMAVLNDPEHAFLPGKYCRAKTYLMVIEITQKD